MGSRILVIISTGDAGKAQAGLMYAVNALKHAWMDEVKLFFFGPAETLILQDPHLQELLQEYQQESETAIACKFIADKEDQAAAISALGIEVRYVGQLISDLIHAGYVPMVW